MAAKKKNKPVAKVVGATPPSSGGGTSKSPTPSMSLAMSVIMVGVAFLCGVFTPPSLHAMQQQPDVNSSATDSSTTVTAASNSIPSLKFPLPTRVPCTPENLANYLHAVPVPGLHVVCVEPIQYNVDGEEQPALSETSDVYEQQRRLNGASSLRLAFYKGSHKPPLLRRIKVGDTSDGGIQSIAWLEVKQHLYANLQLQPEGPLQQPWAVFTALGERIVGENDVISKDPNGLASNNHIMNTIAASGMIVIAQGGNWLWPGVREGFQRTIEVSSEGTSSSGAGSESRNITIETLSLSPLVLSIEGFLSDEECEYIQDKASPKMKYSSVTLKDADKGRAASDWRTSQSTFLSAQDDPILTAIEHRTASLTRVPRNHQEYVQVLRYGHTEKYDAHHDYFDPSAYRADKNTLNLIENGKKNRFATVFWYLTDVDEGGHTIFPRAGGLPPVRNHADCSRGLKVQPQKGKVIIFYSLDASGAMDPLSLHGACPVGEDNVKWAANKWLWNAPMGYVRD